MCGKKPKVQAATPAAPVSAPIEQQLTSIDTEGTKRKKAKGKKSLVVGSAAKGTGVNI